MNQLFEVEAKPPVKPPRPHRFGPAMLECLSTLYAGDGDMTTSEVWEEVARSRFRRQRGPGLPRWTDLQLMFSVAAARDALKRLESLGLVGSERIKEPPGKGLLVWSLTDAGKGLLVWSLTDAGREWR